MITLSWIAIICLSLSYWFQIWHVHVHKETRDLSLPYHILLALGFGILTYTAYAEGSIIFLVKQIATTIPVIILIGQILYHRQDTYEDEEDLFCDECNVRLKPKWAADRKTMWLVCPKCSK